jgi:hypothetical protein
VVAHGEPPRRFALACAQGADPRAELFRLAVARGWTLVELTPARASLEEVFVRLTTRDLEGDAADAANAADAASSAEAAS